jgi:transposase-like protein
LINFSLTLRSLEDLTGEDRLFKQLKKALIERALGTELSEHLGGTRKAILPAAEPATAATGPVRRLSEKTGITLASA